MAEVAGEAQLERRYRWMLRWYPRAYRDEYEDEMVGVLLAGRAPGQRWPAVVDLVVGAGAVLSRVVRARA